jgi:hypothetical protein
MLDPWIAADGHSYEKKAIQEWFSSRGARSPTTVSGTVRAAKAFARISTCSYLFLPLLPAQCMNELTPPTPPSFMTGTPAQQHRLDPKQRFEGSHCRFNADLSALDS